MEEVHGKKRLWYNDLTPGNCLRQNGRIYHLERHLELLATEGRPLSQSGDLEQLWAKRAPLYAAFRDVRMDNNGPAEDTARAIWRDFLCAY